jgi:hypothetical protein
MISALKRIGRKGQISLESAIGAVVFFIAFYVFLTIYDPIANQLLFPILDNTEKVAYGPQAKLVILIIPMIMAVMGIILIVRQMQGRGGAPPVYYQ